MEGWIRIVRIVICTSGYRCGLWESVGVARWWRRLTLPSSRRQAAENSRLVNDVDFIETKYTRQKKKKTKQKKKNKVKKTLKLARHARHVELAVHRPETHFNGLWRRTALQLDDGPRPRWRSTWTGPPGGAATWNLDSTRKKSKYVKCARVCQLRVKNKQTNKKRTRRGVYRRGGSPL